MSELNESIVLAKAVFKTTQQLGIDQDQLEVILGLPLNSNGSLALDPISKERKSALSLIRIYQALYALCGGDVDRMRYFMNSTNEVTGGVPIHQIKTAAGLDTVLQYVEAMLAKG